MAEKKRGRPRGDTTMVAVYARVPEDEAKAFEDLVRRRSVAATGQPDSLSTSSVLRGLMKAAVEADAAAAPADVAPPAKPKPKR